MDYEKKYLNSHVDVDNPTPTSKKHINIYSQEYAKENGIKPRASSSISIGMGGIKRW